MTKIILGPRAFELSDPYEAGQIITASEARALNSVRAANIRRAVWNKASRDGVESPEGIATLVAEYDAGYSFSEKRVREGRVSRLEVEVRLVAEAQVDIEFSRAGLAPEGPEFEARVESILADDRVVEEAQRRLDIKAKVADSTLEDLLL